MSTPLTRAALFPEPELPDTEALIANGRALARTHAVVPGPFLVEHAVTSEIEFKQRHAAAGRVMTHGQIGYRSLAASKRAYAHIHERLTRAGHGVDRYGICLDWSMGYPKAERAGRPKGTGLILESTEDFARLTAMAPVAPHFGDFVLGMPAAVENTCAALAAGATAIGNLGQYFAFRLPHWDNDVATTAATVTALSLCAAQPVPVLIHSNLDDGFAALFTDLASAYGAVLIERHIVETLIGGRLGHCYGHTFSDPLNRLAFQRALAADAASGPGTMVYGNTTAYGEDDAANYAALAAYLSVDIDAQRSRPTGHAVNPVPLSEARRIPDVDEIVDAHLFAARLIEDAPDRAPLLDLSPADARAAVITEGGKRFCAAMLAGLREAGIDTANPFELLLALRRIGARELEARFGPGEAGPEGRRPLVEASPVAEIAERARAVLDGMKAADRERISQANLIACVATTDVHEYGKLLLEQVLAGLGVAVVDGGVSVDADVLAAKARDGGAHFIALSTYNGVALEFVKALSGELAAQYPPMPVFVGGKLNQVPADSNSSLPVDVSTEINAAGAIACPGVEDMLRRLLTLKGPKT